MIKRFKKVLAVTLSIAMLLSVGFIAAIANNDGDWRDNPDLLLWDDFARHDLEAGFDEWYDEFLESIGGGQEFVLEAPLRRWLTEVSVQTNWIFAVVQATGRHTWAPFSTFYPRWASNWTAEWLERTDNGENPGAWDRDAQHAWLLTAAETGGTWVSDDLNHVTLWSTGERAQAIDVWVDLWELRTYGATLPLPNAERRALLRTSLDESLLLQGVFHEALRNGSVERASGGVFAGTGPFNIRDFYTGGNFLWFMNPYGIHWGWWDIWVNHYSNLALNENFVNAWMAMDDAQHASFDTQALYTLMNNVFTTDELYFWGGFGEVLARDFAATFPGGNPVFPIDTANFADDIVEDLLDVWSGITAQTIDIEGWRQLEQGWYDNFEVIDEEELRAAFRAGNWANGGRLGRFNVVIDGEVVGPPATAGTGNPIGWATPWLFNAANGVLAQSSSNRTPQFYGNNDVQLDTSDTFVSVQGLTTYNNNRMNVAHRRFDAMPGSLLSPFMGTGALNIPDGYIGFVDDDLWFSVTMRQTGVPNQQDLGWIAFGNSHDFIAHEYGHNAPMLAVGYRVQDWGSNEARTGDYANWWAGTRRGRPLNNAINAWTSTVQGEPDNRMFDAPIVPDETVLVVIHFNFSALDSTASPFDGTGLTSQRAALLTMPSFWNLFTDNEADRQTTIGFINSQALQTEWDNNLRGLDNAVLDVLVNTLFHDFNATILTNLINDILAPIEAGGWHLDIAGYDQMTQRQRAEALVNVISTRTFGADIVTVYFNPCPDSLGGDFPVVTNPENVQRFEFAPREDTFHAGGEASITIETGKFRADTIMMSSRFHNIEFGDIRFGRTFASVTPTREVPSPARIVVDDNEENVTGVVFAPNAVTSAAPVVMLATFADGRLVSATAVTNGLSDVEYSGNSNYRHIDLGNIPLEVQAGEELRAFVWNNAIAMTPMTYSQLVWPVLP